jgi:AraC-like DNA-binding protein
MKLNILEELLTTLDVRVHAFALCEIQEGFRLKFDPMEAVVVHYVLAGQGVLHQEGDKPVPFGTGCMMLVAPGRAQSLATDRADFDVAADQSCRFLADGLLKFDAREGAGDLLVVCGTITATYGGSFGLFDHQAGPIVEDIRNWPDMRSAFETLLRELSDPRMGTRALTEALMKQCLILLLRNHLDQSGPEAPLFQALRDPKLARAVAAVLAQPGAAHTLESLAEVAGMSRSVFAERFASTYRQTPFAFIQLTRLRNAARLLSVSDLPVKAIAASIGYASRSHFSRAFKTAFGLDPTSYRAARSANDELDRPMIGPPDETV